MGHWENKIYFKSKTYQRLQYRTDFRCQIVKPIKMARYSHMLKKIIKHKTFFQGLTEVLKKFFYWAWNIKRKTKIKKRLENSYFMTGGW